MRYATRAPLLDVETGGRHGNGQREAFLEHYLGAVERQIDPVEAGVGPRIETDLGRHTVYGKVPYVPVVRLEDAKAP